MCCLFVLFTLGKLSFGYGLFLGIVKFVLLIDHLSYLVSNMKSSLLLFLSFT